MVDLVYAMSVIVDCILEIRDMRDKFDRLETIVIQILRQITECCHFVREYIGHGFFGIPCIYYFLLYHDLTYTETERMTLVESRQKIDAFRDVFFRLKEQLNLGIATNTALVIARMSEEIDLLCKFVVVSVILSYI